MVPTPQKPPYPACLAHPARGAELCAGKAWPGRAYNSHNAAPTRRGELQPRVRRRAEVRLLQEWLQSHVQACKQRPGAGGSQQAAANVPGSAALPRAALAPGSRPPTLHPLSSTPSDPAAAPVPATLTTTRLPHPSPRSEPRRGCIVAPGPAAPRATRPPVPP